MRVLSLPALLIVLISGCAGPFQLRKTNWSVGEVQDWYPKYRQTRYAWDGILYQGSDTKRHHFLARVLSEDNWAIIRIKKEELTIPDERPCQMVSSGTLGYYYVDPTQNFRKLRDFK